jgi:hypothetical protein
MGRAAVCVLRIEAQQGRLVITVSMNQDLDRRLYTARPESRVRTTDLDEALAITDRFLRAFAVAVTPPRE